MAPLISVILPVYNSERYIKEAVDSILNQTFENFEFIIINDASTDKTEEILLSYQDKRIKLVCNPENLKVSKCLNIGLNLAKGNYIARMDADDIALSNRFEVQLKYFDNNPDIDVLGSYVSVFGDNEFILRMYEKHDDIKAALLFLNIIVHPSVMFKRAAFISQNLFYDPAFTNAEDYGFWIDALDTMRFATTPHLLLKYRVHTTNASVKKSSNWLILREMNFMAYRKIFLKMGLSVTTPELEIHLNLGFKNIESMANANYKEYIKWIKKIALSNKQSEYFNPEALRNQLLHKLIYLTKNKKTSIGDKFFLVKNLISLYNIKDYAGFFKYRSTYIDTLNRI